MTLHYHGTPITPNALMYELKGNCFCVSWWRPDQLEIALQVGQSVLGDNGAFSRFTAIRRALEAAKIAGEPMTEDEFYSRLHAPVDWTPYYAWCEPIIAKPENWVVIPDIIDAGSQEQDRLIGEWPHGDAGAPVWHMDEPIERLLRLCDEWPKVCIGSTGEFWEIPRQGVVLSREYPWEERMDDVFTELGRRHSKRWPWLHMLRGMQLVDGRWPFASVDSSDVGQNHNRFNVDDGVLIGDGLDKPRLVVAKAADWNGRQTPRHFARQPARAVQTDLLGANS